MFDWKEGAYVWEIAPPHWHEFIRMKRERVKATKQPELSIEVTQGKNGKLYHATWVDKPLFARNSTRVIGWRGYGSIMK